MKTALLRIANEFRITHDSLRIFLAAIVAATLLSHIGFASEVRGIVRDPSGAAIVNARIELHTAKEFLSTFSDGAGSFRLRASASTGVLTISAPGFAPATIPWPAADSPAAFILQPASVAQQIVVTAERAPTPIAQTSANVISFSSDELNREFAPTLDDALRQAPGFTLFRRSSSLSANPTTQGASVRGVGASGASRVLVLQDGIPRNDAFGGWVYWDRTPRLALESAETLRSGGGNVYGSSALGGVVNLLTRGPDDLVASEVSGDSLYGHNAEAYLSHRVNQWVFSASGESFGNAGAFIVAAPARGTADARTELAFSNGSVRVERAFSSTTNVFLAGSLFAEERGNGTRLQTNSTHLGEVTTGLDLEAGKNIFAIRLYGTGERYHQSFSALSTDRNLEFLVRRQTVPSDQIGLSAQWTRTVSVVRLNAGVDGRFVHGESDEILLTSARATSLIHAGGANDIVGFFAEAAAPISKRLRVSLGGRIDEWLNGDGFSRTTILPKNVAASSTLRPHRETALSPRAGLVYDIAGPLQLTASAYGGFRAPTLNELYRSFRLGNIVTLANDQLRAEHLAGGEAGLRYARSRAMVSATFFNEDVNDPIGNVTQSVTPKLITRERQNIGGLRARGVDIDALLVFPHIQLRSGYEYVNSKITSFSANRALVGNFVPEVPAQTFTISAIYNAPHHWAFESLVRASSRQFDDDENRFALTPYSTVGVSLSKSFGALTWFASASNLLNTAVEASATPVPTLASPRIVSVGVRWISSGGR